MASFFVDENLPRTLAKALVDKGHSAVVLKDTDQRGKSDEDIYSYVKDRGILISRDLGLGI